MMCACGEKATANGRECPQCFRDRIGTVHNAFTPTRTHGFDPKAQAQLDRRLANYKSARDDGIQPATTRQKDVDTARAISDGMGMAFQAGTLSSEDAA